MPLPNLPEDVVRILSFHGPVEMVCEGELGLISEKVEVAPFDSHLVAFLRPGGALAEALLLTGRAEVQARHTEGTYSLRMTGVAHPGIAVGRRSDRASLTPWLPERGGNGLLAAEFIPHRIELSRQEGANTVRYHGPTPAGQQAPSRLRGVVRAGFTQSGVVGTLVAFPAVFGFLAWEGPEVPWRPVALMVAWLGAVFGAVGLRLVMLMLTYDVWRRIRGNSDECFLVTSGVVSYGDARFFGLWCLGLWGFVVLLCWGLWSQGLALTVFFGSLVPLYTAAGLVHLGAGKPDRAA